VYEADIPVKRRGRRVGNREAEMVFILLIAIFGVGTILEAAFWTLLIIAALIVAAFVLVSRLVRS
jgi:hypothetical protein